MDRMPLKLIFEAVVLVACAIMAMRGRIPCLRLARKLQLTAGRFARRKTLVCISLAVLVLAVRAALLPIWPIPKPSMYDEFGYLLQADTFGHGRLSNLPHPLWQFFESIYI